MSAKGKQHRSRAAAILAVGAGCWLAVGCATGTDIDDPYWNNDDDPSVTHMLQSGSYVLTYESEVSDSCGVSSWEPGDTVDMDIAVSGGSITLDIGSNTINGVIDGNVFDATLETEFDWSQNAAAPADCRELLTHRFSALLTADNTFSLTYDVMRSRIAGEECDGLHAALPCTERRVWLGEPTDG